MSQRLISLSPDLKRLRDEGYGVDVRAGCLVVTPVPYLRSDGTVAVGTLVVPLNLASEDKLLPPGNHVVHFAGEIPYDQKGARMDGLVADSNAMEMGGMQVQHRLSRHLPDRQYSDYHEQVTTYVALISTPAEQADPAVNARAFKALESEEGESPLRYADTASSRAGIDPISRKLAGMRIAIVGAGGTGSYLLDMVAKTHVAEIHAFDGDTFLLHNAYRSPGAPSKEELESESKKVDYLGAIYSKMHRGIVPHPYYLSAENADELRGFDFVFLCLDRAGAKKAIVEKLEELGIPFIAVGMGINEVEGALTGLMETVTSTPENRDSARASIALTGEDAENAYSRNIQIAELNAMNAALAVIKWKKLFGFYGDVERERCSSYSVSSNKIINTDQA